MGCCQTLRIVKVPSNQNLFPPNSDQDSNRKLLYSNESSNIVDEDINSIEKKSTVSFRVRKSSLIKRRSGNLLEEFEILQNMGSGGYGDVYKAKDKVTGLIRAIKSIKKSIMHTEHILIEIENLKEVVKNNQDHPNIVRILEFIEEPTTYYIITDLCTGSNLIERITNSVDFSENQAAKYMYQIFSALSHCHKLGIAHRDIKPENLLFESQDENSLLKVIDFGHSCKLIENQKFTELLGTVIII